MKPNLWEVLADIVALLIGVLAATALVALVVHPLAKRWTGLFYVLVNAGVWLLAYGFTTAMLVRAVLGFRPLIPGVYSQDHAMAAYWRWVTVQTHFGMGALFPINNILTLPLLYSLFGARVGKGVAVGGKMDTPSLVSIGNGSVLGNNSLVSGDMLSDGKIILGPVSIGDGVTVGAQGIVFPNVTIGKKASVQAGSVVYPGCTIPDGETWRGIPARKWL